MLTLYKNEWLKMKRQHVWILILFIPIVGALLGTFSFYSSYELLTKDTNEWYQLWTQVTFFYGLFLYPVLSSVYATLICRNENLQGGWKLILGLPVSHVNFYLSKLLWLLTLLLYTQMIILLATIMIGYQFDFISAIPIVFFIKATIFGWFATFPLAVIQLSISMKTKSFSLPLGINIILTFGSLAAMVIGVELFYPWAFPSIAMAAPGEGSGTDTMTFIAVMIISFCILLLIGSWNFKRREIK
ncbi:ABC transporter permease [Bacillus sp. FJAT-49705]|uniref:ABC transporter permease n=1 Tax=Cytobacillus citreus TaxID=2833586 RepID=A0ABS5NZ84_9BACI|nr:ABC transporter permease [Cytobacillus citreus]MBS4193130.1 ABC transporter permease [Cytobacillus citreus]